MRKTIFFCCGIVNVSIMLWLRRSFVCWILFWNSWVVKIWSLGMLKVAWLLAEYFRRDYSKSPINCLVAREFFSIKLKHKMRRSSIDFDTNYFPKWRLNYIYVQPLFSSQVCRKHQTRYIFWNKTCIKMLSSFNYPTN